MRTEVNSDWFEISNHFESRSVYMIENMSSLQFEILIRSNWPKWNLHLIKFHFARSNVNADNEAPLHRREILHGSEISNRF